MSFIKKIKLIINATFCLDRNRNPNGPTTVRIVDLPASPRKLKKKAVVNRRSQRKRKLQRVGS